MNNDLIEKLLGKTSTVAEICAKYPARNLPQDAKVTRFAPSPTGYIHIGGLYMALINKMLANQSNGVFYLRIEDTDQKREIENASYELTKILKNFSINFNEGPAYGEGYIQGIYGPYFQSQRKDIYNAFIAFMLENDLAYPCFCSNEELDELRKQQEKENVRPGYYGKYASCRNLTEEQIEKNLIEKKPFVIRFKSQNSFDDKVKITDLIRGNLEFPGYDIDVVILKSDGLPTYHFAHVTDDSLMGTTHVIRGEEWLSSLPLHIQLFKALNFKIPKYAHLSTIDKLDDGKRRKLSKRKDPEANVEFFIEQGYPQESVIKYLLNLANSNFEEWEKQNKDKPWKDFSLSLKKFSQSGALFDFAKLDSISKEVISQMSAQDLFDAITLWARFYNENLHNKMTSNSDYILNILNIERNCGNQSRKDIIKFSDIPNEISYFFDDEFIISDEIKKYDSKLIKSVKEKFLSTYSINDSQNNWWEKIQKISDDLGYCSDMKEYKINSKNYKGNVSDISNILRLLLTGRSKSPNLYLVMQVMGEKRIKERLNA